MTFDVGLLYAVGVGYLALLFFIAHAVERGWLSYRLVRHPWIYALSLGVYATSWSFYGSVGFAKSEGFAFLTIYIGVTIAFALTPLLLKPILRLSRDYQLTSLADLFAFRYRSPWTGLIVTLFMLVGVLPYISLQIKAVTESVQFLTEETPSHIVSLGFCITLSLFAILFGARHITPREKHEGLVVAIAFESAVKLLALLAVGAFAVWGIFGGPGGLDHWLAERPEAIEALHRPIHGDGWGTLILLAFAAAFLLPRQFHMIFAENIEPRALNHAAWAFPLFLLLLNLPILPVLWAGEALALEMPADYYVLGIPLASGSGWLTLLTFIGGVSAASAMMIVTTLALAAMCLNHLILPARFFHSEGRQRDLYGWLLWGRRVLIVLIVLLGYGFYRLMEFHEDLVQIGLLSFVAVAQFLPGIFGLLFWPRATHAGFIAGLAAGIVVWAGALIIPLLGGVEALPDIRALLPNPGWDRWTFTTFWSLAANTFLFIAISLLTRPSPGEVEAAQAAARERILPATGRVHARSVAEFETLLAHSLGSWTASQEVSRALADLGLTADEGRPAELQRLRERLERNLSGLVGPLLARMIVDDSLHVDPHARSALADSLRFVEERLEHSTVRLQGVAAELDTLRRYHRQILHELPVGICSLSPSREIVIWNGAIANLSGITAEAARGLRLDQLPEPWSGVLRGFVNGDDRHLYKLQISQGGRSRWISLHKAAIETPESQAAEGLGGTVLLVEDLTELHTLESEVAHNNRLASIGRLAAGVAHEIGNPLTGIASLAQNLRYERDPEEIEAATGQILGQTRRINDIVQSLVTFAHAGTTAPRPVERVAVRECAAEALALIQLARQGREISCTNTIPEDMEVMGDHQRLVQVFVNLLTNSIHASKPGDRVRMSGRAHDKTAEITLDDEGSGIPPEYMDRIFEPFFTTKPPGEGTGLGLPVAYSIIHDHNGMLHAENLAGGGMRMTIRLPTPPEDGK